MSITNVSAQDLVHDFAQVSRAMSEGPVFITQRGKPAFALLRIEEYYKLIQNKPRTLLEIMDAIPGGDFEFEPPRLSDDMGLKPAEFD